MRTRTAPVVDDGAMTSGTGDGGRADGGRAEVLDLDRLAAVEAELAAVEHALGRLDAGTWGTCEVCAAPLEPEVLQRRPTARTCAAHEVAGT
jgi:RNA polymerase-binding transcription factor DksA